VLLERAARRATGNDRKRIAAAVDVLRAPDADEERRHAAALDPELLTPSSAIPTAPPRRRWRSDCTSTSTRCGRASARGTSCFPRSWGGLEGVRKRIPELAELGFDVLYCRRSTRSADEPQGPNNALTPARSRAIPARAVGDRRLHRRAHRGACRARTIEDFDALVATAGEHGIAVALDFAIQCSADHPWLTEHPEWFHRRPDGTLKYAENPRRSTRTSTTSTGTARTGEGCGGAARRRPLLASHGVTTFRVATRTRSRSPSGSG